MISKLLVILLCLFMSFGTVFVYGYDSEAQYRAVERENQQTDIQYQLNEIREQLEQQRIQDQADRLIDDCNRDYWD